MKIRKGTNVFFLLKDPEQRIVRGKVIAHGTMTYLVKYFERNEDFDDYREKFTKIFEHQTFQTIVGLLENEDKSVADKLIQKFQEEDKAFVKYMNENSPKTLEDFMMEQA